MNNKKVMELVEICLAFDLAIKIKPEQREIVVTFKHVGMAGAKLIPFTTRCNVTSLDIELVRDVVSMITAGDTRQAVEKRINEFVPF